MATFASFRTSPTDVAIRLQEVEAVLKGVLEKLAGLTAPENPDLTAVNAALDRLYRIVTFGSYTGSPSPRGETVFDQASNSLFYAIFGYNKDRVAAILDGGSTGRLARSVSFASLTRNRRSRTKEMSLSWASIAIKFRAPVRNSNQMKSGGSPAWTLFLSSSCRRTSRLATRVS